MWVLISLIALVVTYFNVAFSNYFITVMEKVFNKHARKGSVKAEQITDMMMQMQPDWTFDTQEMANIIGVVDRKGCMHI